MEIAVDEAKGRHHFLIQGVFDTPEQIVAMAKAGEAIGVSGILLGQPNSFYPKTEDELYGYISRRRGQDRPGGVHVLHDADEFRAASIRPAIRKVSSRGWRSCRTSWPCKYEVGRPGRRAAISKFWKKLKGKRVLFSDPLEAHSPMMVEMLGQQWMGTSNYEYWGGAVPQYFRLLLEGQFEKAMEIYWRINPARQARVQIQTTFAGAQFIHRYLWKYQGWLHGYNGGPMRQPVMKIGDNQMRAVREPLVRCGFDVTRRGCRRRSIARP